MPDTNVMGLDPNALRRLDASVQADIDTGKNFGASIIVARGGIIGHRAAFGTVAPDRAPKDDDRYLMMSLSKSFTAALVLRAVDHGLFSLDTRAADILPGFGAGGKQRVTVRMLLTHTAGTFAGMLPPGLAPGELGNLSKFVGAISSVPATNVPGERVVYNTAASYAALGQMLVATDPAKRSFRAITRQDLFEPLGMMDTVYGLSQDDPRRVPVSYTPSNTTPATDMAVAAMNAGFVEGAEVPAGSAFATIDDVFRFTEVYRQRGTANGYRLLSPALFDYARQNHTGSMSNGAWDFWREVHGLPDYPANFSLMGGYVRGNGFFLNGAGYTASPSTFYAVGGGSTMWLIDPDRDLTFIFLSAGFIDGLAHFDRLRRLSDLAIAACLG
ncbi:serine hydrolase domain-containing protein [Aureimonas psammosilenae]|uniref:serine hydrolase domain-containing protein n=1 Tax=Aureimonas psammosilenae TaxID=2495496 RepID=UPI00126129E0|nr:serine hydrolase domain-containing protein [Aureimonas psammosilenae]